MINSYIVAYLGMGNAIVFHSDGYPTEEKAQTHIDNHLRKYEHEIWLILPGKRAR